MSLEFNDGIHFDKNFLMGRSRSTKQSGERFLISDGEHAICASTLLEDIKRIAVSIGYMDPVSTKSAKVINWLGYHSHKSFLRNFYRFGLINS